MLGVLGGIWGKLAIGLAIVGAVLAVLMGAKSAGRTEERLRQKEAEVKGARVRQKIESEMGSASDADIDKWLQPPGARR